MRCAGDVPCTEEKIYVYTILERGHLEDLRVDRKTILKLILDKKFWEDLIA
jgi:hypothetical protein